MGDLINLHDHNMQPAPTTGDPYRPMVLLDELPPEVFWAPSWAWVVGDDCQPGAWYKLEEGLILRGKQGGILIVADSEQDALCVCHSALSRLKDIEAAEAAARDGS